MAKFDIKTVKPKFVVTTSPENKIDVVVNKPIIETKLSKSFFKLKNTGGPAGQPGRDGQDGQSATIEVASTTTLPAGSSATVENVGTDSAARLAFGIPKGDTGAAGVDGDAATIQVGQVETLEPNQQAYVTNVGTSSEAIFNIGIPKGQKGDSGSGTGDMLASVYDPSGTVAAAGGIPDYVDSNGGKIDTIKVNGTTQTITNKTVDLSVPTKTSDITNDSGYITSASLPTKTSDLTNDGADGTSTYVEADELPAVNDATLTIQHNGTTVQTFTANQGTNATANIETIYAETITPTTAVATIGTTQIADGAITPAKLSDTGWVLADQYVNTTYFSPREHIYYRILGGVVYWQGQIYCHTAPSSSDHTAFLLSGLPNNVMPLSETSTTGQQFMIANGIYNMWTENNGIRVWEASQQIPVTNYWEGYDLTRLHYISSEY